MQLGMRNLHVAVGHGQKMGTAYKIKLKRVNDMVVV
jgi:hypothetical protein